jgi:hypothetical protein
LDDAATPRADYNYALKAFCRYAGLQIHQIPVLLGCGRRLFEELPSRVELEIVRVIDTPEATHIRYRVRR